MEQNTTTEIRKEYAVAIGFIGPQEGIVTVYARDEEHAREIVREQFKNRTDLSIADVFDMDLRAMADPLPPEASSLN